MNHTGDVFDRDCSGREIAEHLTGRWSPLILAALTHGPMRFFELRDRINGISEKMLSQKLRVLVRDGLIGRSVEPTIPPQVTYELTTLGAGLSAPLLQLVAWIGQHTPEVVAAQAHYDSGSS